MAQPRGSATEVFLAFLKLGLTSFGGPIAHLGYFRAEFVAKRAWLEEGAFADLVALCQFLPGPASSQVGMAIGLSRAGLRGAAAAWTAFTLPSAIALTLFAYGLRNFGDQLGSGWLHGLKIAAVAVVALAVLGMARSLAPDRARASIAILAALGALSAQSTWGQIGAIVFGGVIGAVVLRDGAIRGGVSFSIPASRAFGLASLASFFALLFALPIAAAATGSQTLKYVDAFYRAGALVFGGGHVVLPLLQASVISPGWISKQAFLAGYGATQAVPGPLFTFSAFLGAAMRAPPNGWLGAAICLVAIFAPSFLLILGATPFWAKLRSLPGSDAVLRGVNAAVVGILVAALYNPVWTAGISNNADFGLAIVDFALLLLWKAPPWFVVALSAAVGAAIPSV